MEQGRRLAQAAGAANLAALGDGIGLTHHSRVRDVARGLGWQSHSNAPSLDHCEGKRIEC
jgi:hypothetical protein